MTRPTVKKNENKKLKMTILVTLAIMLVLVIAWHLILSMLGITIALSAGLWGVAVITTVLICVATLLFFIFTGIGVFILGIFVFAWTALAIILFPLLFPIMIPLLLLMFIIGLIANKKK